MELLACSVPSRSTHLRWFIGGVSRQFRLFRVCGQNLFATGFQLIFSSIALHFNTTNNAKRLKLFWTAFTAMFIYEIIPAYIFPLLNGFSIVCLATQKASSHTVDVVTNLFGGT